MRVRAISLLILCVVGLLPGSAYGIGLWFNGDWLGYPPSYNPLSSAGHCFFNDFNVGPSGWVVEEVWGHFALKPGYPVATSASWEIRSGMSGGGGGTLVASGQGLLTRTPVGWDAWYYEVNRIALTGLSVNLAPGSYWVGIGMYVPGQVTCLYRTTGANAIGTPAGNNGNTYERLYNNYSLRNYDHSMGVNGRDLTEPIPEPASLALLGLGLAVLVLGAAVRGRTS